MQGCRVNERQAQEGSFVVDLLDSSDDRASYLLSLWACHLPVFAAKKEQWFSALNFCVFDLTHDKCVISRDMSRNDAAAQLHDRVFQNRNVLRGPAIAQSKAVLRFGVLLRLREILRDRLLIVL